MRALRLGSGQHEVRRLGRQPGGLGRRAHPARVRLRRRNARLEPRVPFAGRSELPIGDGLRFERGVHLDPASCQRRRGTLCLQCGRVQALLGPDRERRRGCVSGTCGAIGLHRDRERLVEVVEAVARVGCRGNRRSLGALSPRGCRCGVSLRPGQLDRVDRAPAAQARWRDHGTVAQDRHRCPLGEGFRRRLECWGDPHAAEEPAHRAARFRRRFDSTRQQDVRLGRRRLGDRTEAGAEQSLPWPFPVEVCGGSSKVIDEPCAEVLLERGRNRTGECFVLDLEAVDEPARPQ